MRHRKAWRPTKFVVVNGRLRGDTSGTYLSIGSRLIGDTMAGRYDAVLRRYARGHLADLGCGNVPFFEVYRDLVDELYVWIGRHRRINCNTLMYSPI